MVFEKQINERFGLNAAVYDTEGHRITNFNKWANGLCHAVKANKKGQSFICAVAHINLANVARQTREPVIEECDAGLLKIVVPIFADGTYLGVAGGCGRLMDNGETDIFLINKITGIDQTEVKHLSQDISAINRPEADAVVEFIRKGIERILGGHYKQGKG
jgi:ligand-binding sensor protein